MAIRVTIVGGGLVGCLLAILLQKRGYRVQIFEQRSDPRQQGAAGGRSINLIVTSRGIHGLEQAGIAESVLKICVPVFGRQVHLKSGSGLFQPYGRQGECNYSVSRSQLNALLLTQAEASGAEVFFDSQLESVDFKSAEAIFCQGTERRVQKYEQLFGADGAGSRVRAAIEAAAPQECVVRTEWLEADYKEMLLPSLGGQYQLDKKALHIWPRGSHMMMALANLDGSFTITLYLPRQAGRWSFSSVNTPAAVGELFSTEFPDAVSLVPDHVQQFMAHPQGALGTVRCSKWIFGGKVALIGDAAHAIVPFFGQGMNCGFEDCTVLMHLLDQGMNWEDALASFDAERRQDANAIADMAVENWIEMRDKVADPAFQLRKKVEARLEEALPGLYRSRYGMVVYTRVPYSKAQAVGRVQDQVLDRLCAGIDSAEQLDLQAAQAMLQEAFRSTLS